MKEWENPSKSSLDGVDPSEYLANRLAELNWEADWN